jgi:TPR repeat protein
MRNAAGRALCTAMIVLPLVACAGLAAADYKVGMMDNNLGLTIPARNSFIKAAKGGNAEAKNMLGWYWANGLGHLPKDIIQACNWYAEAAVQGLADAIYNFGTCYEYPGFIQQDINKAIAQYTLAARKGN